MSLKEWECTNSYKFALGFALECNLGMARASTFVYILTQLWHVHPMKERIFERVCFVSCCLLCIMCLVRCCVVFFPLFSKLKM
jgi:hypothetical protein